MELSSSMPAVEEIEAHLKIKMVTVALSDCEVIPDALTTIRLTRNGESADLKTTIYKITTPEVGEYIPSRVWHDEEDGFMMLYYICASLPPQVRPFDKGDAYAIVLPKMPKDMVVEYDADVRMLVDQIQTSAGMRHFVIFGASSYDRIVSEVINAPIE